jgi:hypothetical protein
MLRAFAATSTEGRKWYPLWALNFDGSPFRLDYRDDDWFVREVPAVFELVEQCYRQYLWSGNLDYLNDPILWSFCTRAVTDFIDLHDTRIPNGVAEGEGSGDIFRGSATYNEIRAPLVEAGDGIACQYQALRSYSKMLLLRNEQDRAKVFSKKSEELKYFFNHAWGVKDGTQEYIRGYDIRGAAVTDFGLENSWFMPMKFITEPGPKTDAYLDFIARSVESSAGRPSNLEAITYLPGVFFPYGRAEEAWKWMEYVMDQPDREYPEVSFATIGHVVEGLLGFEPNAPDSSFQTLSHLPRSVKDVSVQDIPLGSHTVHVGHVGRWSSRAIHVSGDEPLRWEACFYGNHPQGVVNGATRPAKSRVIHGVETSVIEIDLLPGQSATVEILRKD